MKTRKRGLLLLAALIISTAVPFAAAAETGARRNAALAYWPAFALIQEPEEEALIDRMYDVISGKLPFDPSDKDLAKVIEDNEQALLNARLASREDYCNFQPDFSRGFSISLSHLSRLRKMTRLMLLQGKQLESQGQWDQALDNYFATLQMAEHGANDELIISTLVCVSGVRQALAALNRCLTNMPADTEALENVKANLDDLGNISWIFQKGLEGEQRQMTISMGQMEDYIQLIRSRIEKLPPQERGKTNLGDLLNQLDKEITETSPHFNSLQYKNFIIHMVAVAMQVAPKEIPQDIFSGELSSKDAHALAAKIGIDDALLEALDRVDDRIQEAAREMQFYLERMIAEAAGPYAESIDGFMAICAEIKAIPADRLSRMSMVGLERFYGYRGEMEEMIDSAKVITLLQIYRAREGKYPAGLAELPQGPWINPRYGKPFDYELTEAGFVLTAPGIEDEKPRVLHEVK